MLITPQTLTRELLLNLIQYGAITEQMDEETICSVASEKITKIGEWCHLSRIKYGVSWDPQIHRVTTTLLAIRDGKALEGEAPQETEHHGMVRRTETGWGLTELGSAILKEMATYGA